MAEEKNNKAAEDVPAEDGGVQRLHFIYHVVADTNQLIKIEQIDEATGKTIEVPLPLLVSFGEGDEEASEESELGTAPAPFLKTAFAPKTLKKPKGIPNPKAGPLKFVPATKGIPPPKAGPLKFVPAEEDEDV